MAASLDEVQGDQEIYGSDGKPIGRVGGMLTDPATGVRYLKVDRGAFLELMGDDLYVPEDAIAKAQLGKSIVLKDSTPDAIARYVFRPGDLK